MGETKTVERVHRDCPSCGTSAASAEDVAYAHPDWPMKRCRNCSLIYLEYVPAFAALFDELAWTKQRERQWERRFKEQPILARLDKWTIWRLGWGDPTPAGGLQAWAPEGPVLDVGCSSGKAFGKLAKRFVPFGIEIERNAAAAANQAFETRGGRVINADGVSGLRQFGDAYFTGISLWSYLEHEAQPKEALSQVRRVIRGDGVVLVKVPNFACWNRSVYGRKWPGFRHPDHVQYFTPETLADLARRCNFSA
jgi:SAM-dependent methyltransferase